MANGTSETNGSGTAGAPDASNAKPSLKQVSQRAFEELSETLLQGAHQVAMEGDYWFLTTLRGLNKGAQHTRAVAARLGRYVLEGSSKLAPSLLRKRTQRERIRDMLLREAKRAKLSGPEFETFSEQIAILVELVLQGSVKVGDIAFERDERLRQST